MAKLTSQEFEQLSRLIIELAGIQLEPGKEYLMEARLEPVLEMYGFQSFDELYREAMLETKGEIKARIIDAITINETYFFRDQVPFELLRNKIIPELIDQKTRQKRGHKPSLKIWSSACSTGQEVYSIAMTLKEMHVDESQINISIMGTDISSVAVAKASYGKYNQFEVDRGLTSYYLNKYFYRVDSQWRIKDQIRSLVNFSKMDLNRSFNALGAFDIVFCRNVAIYFPMQGKVRLFQKIADLLTPNGALLVGGSETLAGIAPDFVPRHYLKGVYYQKKLQTGEKEKELLTPSARIKKPIPLPPKLPPTPPKTEANRRISLRKKNQEKPQTPSKPDVPREQEPKQPSELFSEVTLPPSLDTREELKGSLLSRIQTQGNKEKTGFLRGKGDQARREKSLLEKLKEQEDKES